VDTLIRDFADVPTDDPPTRLMLVNWLEFQPQLWTELAQKEMPPAHKLRFCSPKRSVTSLQTWHPEASLTAIAQE